MKLEILRHKQASDSPTPRVSFGDVIFAQRAKADAQADRIVADAVERAARIVTQARQDAADMLIEANREGQSKGVSLWLDAAVELAHERSNWLQTRTTECVRLAMEIARRVVLSELSARPEALAATAANAARGLSREARLVVSLPPSASDASEGIRTRLGADRPVEILLDPALGDGDVILECAGVRVDARLDSQLATILSHLEANGDLATDAEDRDD